MSDQQLDQHELQQEENKLIAQRKEKLAAVREARAIAFPNDFRRDAYFADLQKQYADKTKEELEAAAIPVKVAGRIMLNRGSFIVLQDSSERLQVYVNRKTLPEETLAEIKTWDLGDIIGAEGVLALRDQVAPPTINLDNPDEGCDLDLVAHEAKPRKIDVALSNSFGFGGTNGTLVFRRFAD